MKPRKSNLYEGNWFISNIDGLELNETCKMSLVIQQHTYKGDTIIYHRDVKNCSVPYTVCGRGYGHFEVQTFYMSP